MVFTPRNRKFASFTKGKLGKTTARGFAGREREREKKEERGEKKGREKQNDPYWREENGIRIALEQDARGFDDKTEAARNKYATGISNAIQARHRYALKY